MKKTFRFAPIIAIAIVSTLFSCVDSEKNYYDSSFQMPNPMGEGFSAPEDFDWAMMQNAQLTVEVNDKYQGQYYYKIEIYDANPIISKDAHILYSGVAKQGEPYKSDISVEKSTKTVYIKEYTPTGLYSVRAADIQSDGSIKSNFKSSVPSTRSLATTRSFTSFDDPDLNDASLFPQECPSNVTKVYKDENSSVAGESYKVTSSIKKISLGQKTNIKLYVTEDVTLDTQIYLTQGSCLYILPGKKVTMPQSKDNGQSNCLISIGKEATLTINNDMQIDNNYKLYNLGTINARNIQCTNSSVFYNVGTADIQEQLSGQNGETKIVNAGNIKTKEVYIQGDAHMLNQDLGTVAVSNETKINCTGGSWQNDGKWTTDDMSISAWNDYCYNKCKLIVQDELKVSDGHLIVDGGGFVQCKELYMNNAKVELGAKSLFKVTEEAKFGYNTKSYGFKGTGEEKALLIMKKAIAEYPQNADMIHYSGNIQIICSDHLSADLGWGKRWTMTDGAEWTEEGKNTISIPKTPCNDGYNSGNETTPSEPEFPIVMDDNKNYAYIFEDQWPLYGDYDLNDIIMVITNRKVSINKKNLVTKFELSIDLRAVGATKKIGAAIMLDAVKASDIKKQVTFGKNAIPQNFKLNNLNIEDKQDNAIIPLFDDAHIALGNNRYEPINTISSSLNNTNDYKSISFTILFDNPTIPADAFNVNKLNVFIIVGGNKDTRREIHVIGFQPSLFAETNIFGGNNDNSSLSNNKYYISKEGLAWGIMVPTNFKWPLEYTNIREAYPEFAGWVTSGGKDNDKWWNNFDNNKTFINNKNQ